MSIPLTCLFLFSSQVEREKVELAALQEVIGTLETEIELQLNKIQEKIEDKKESTAPVAGGWSSSSLCPPLMSLCDGLLQEVNQNQTQKQKWTIHQFED